MRKWVWRKKGNDWKKSKIRGEAFFSIFLRFFTQKERGVEMIL